MTLLLKDTTELTLIAVIVTVLVVVTMSIDLVAGVMFQSTRPRGARLYDMAEGKLYFWNGAALTQK